MLTPQNELSPVLPPAKTFCVAFRASDRRPMSFEHLIGDRPLGSRTALVTYRKDIEGFASEWKRLFGKRLETWEDCLLPKRVLNRFAVYLGGRSVEVVLPVWLTPSAGLNELVRRYTATRLQAFAERCAELPLPPAPEHPGKDVAPIVLEFFQLAQARWLFLALVDALKHGAPDSMMVSYFGTQPLAWVGAACEHHPEGDVKPAKVPPR